MTCNSRSGPTEISPEKGPLCEAMSTMETATPVAKIPIAMAAPSLLSLCTMAIATSANKACNRTLVHLTQLTVDSLRMMR